MSDSFNRIMQKRANVDAVDFNQLVETPAVRELERKQNPGMPTAVSSEQVMQEMRALAAKAVNALGGPSQAVAAFVTTVKELTTNAAAHSAASSATVVPGFNTTTAEPSKQPAAEDHAKAGMRIDR